MFDVWNAAFLGGVQRVQQAKSNWCWAAGAEMVGAYKTTYPKDQWAIVGFIYGTSYPNVAGSISNVVSGVEYASNYTKDARSSAFISLTSLTNEISAKQHPVLIRIGWSNSNSGHVVVASGYNGSDIKIIDPWENTATQYYTYSSLANGGTFANGTGTATHVVLYNNL